MVTVGSGWTPPAEYFKGDDGPYTVTLVRIGVEDRDGNFTEGATRTYDSSFGERTVKDWRFALEDGQVIDASVTAPAVRNGEEVIHPKSTYYAYIVALAGGKSIPEGYQFDEQKLIGRMAVATIQRDDKGYPRIVNLGAVPTSVLSQKVAEATGAPVTAAPAAAPLREAVAAVPAQTDAIPF